MCTKLILVYLLLLRLQGLFTSESGQMIDLSNECKNAVQVNYFLTYGMGIVDSTVITLNTEEKNCTITFHSDSTKFNKQQIEILQILVLETVLTNPNKTVDLVNYISIVDANHSETSFEEDLNAAGLFVGVFIGGRTSLHLDGAGPALKITATSARVSIGAPCLENELKCRVNDYFMCIDAELLCDGNINCGSHVYHDEAPFLCIPELRMQHFWFIMTCIIIFLFSIAAFAKCLYNFIIPKIPKSYFKDNPEQLMDNEDNQTPIRVGLYNKPIRLSQKKSPRVVLNYRHNEKQEAQAGTNDSEVEEELQTHWYAAGKLYQANQKMKRMTTNSPVVPRPRPEQFLSETFDREMMFLSESDGKRHRLKSHSYLTS